MIAREEYRVQLVESTEYSKVSSKNDDNKSVSGDELVKLVENLNVLCTSNCPLPFISKYTTITGLG